MWGLADSSEDRYTPPMDTVISLAFALWPMWVAVAAGVAAHVWERT